MLPEQLSKTARSFLYYGGGDKHIAVASANLDDFLQKLKNKGTRSIFKKDYSGKITIIYARTIIYRAQRQSYSPRC